MADVGLVELARKFVRLSDELEAVRGEIARAVLNGAGPQENPPPPVRSSGGSHPNAIAAKEAEQAIIEVLRSSPGMGTAAVARATDSKVNTTAQRLARLRDRGMIAGGGGGGWTASTAP